jgi:RNA polymerase sigma-70 factor (ECF subfamily)
LEAAALAAASGDREAFAGLCSAIEADVWRYCWAILGERHLADEAAQETFVRAVTAIRRFRGDAPVKAWICVIARRVCFDMLRRRPRIPTPVDPALAALRCSPEPGEVVDALMLLRSLDDDVRSAFVLTQLVGLSYAEAAATAGVPVGTIRSRVHRARSQLADAWLGHPRAEDRNRLRPVWEEPS